MPQETLMNGPFRRRPRRSNSSTYFQRRKEFSNYAYPETREDRGHRRARNLADEQMAREAWYLNERKFTDAIAELVVR
jgi:hypothetical protein